MKKRILFLDNKNSIRSQLAEAMVNKYWGDKFQAVSAGLHPRPVHPMTLRCLAELDIDHRNAKSKHVDIYAGIYFDYVFSLCDEAKESCPWYFDGETIVKFDLPDPSLITGTVQDQIGAFRKVRDELWRQLQDYFFEDVLEKTAHELVSGAASKPMEGEPHKAGY